MMKKLMITLIALVSVQINPGLASDFFAGESNDFIALQEYEMSNIFEEGMRSMNLQAERHQAQTTHAVAAKLDLDLAQQFQTDQVLESLKQEQQLYLQDFMLNTVVNVHTN